jgi:SAM-dependent methyltransferase
MDSTSIHGMNADKGLSLPQKLLWFSYNWLNNLFPNAGTHGLAIRDFVADISERNWSRTNTESKPSRRLSDLFWLHLPWKLMKAELGQINVLDTGCGSGDYGTILQSYSEGSIASYTGLDISRHDNWSALTSAHPDFRFHTADSSNMSEYFPDDANLFISQSAIEHFEHDLRYFEQIREFARNKKKSIMQVHLFPSPACLRLYLLHGVRQYTPRTISKAAHLYRLGGRECNRLHWEYFTKPLFLQKIGVRRRIKTQEYDGRLRQAILADNDKPHRQPSFYALVIHSNWSTRIFEQF